MLDLNDPKWSEFKGGYGIPYNASVPLLKLERANDTSIANAILDELWEELHHQGDVGVASYMSVPHLIRIAKEKQLVNWRILGLIALIEIQRHKNMPDLPNEYKDGYFIALKNIPELVVFSLNDDWDLSMASSALSALAIAKGQLTLADAISMLDSEDVIDEFLTHY